ncbi:MAG TPA: trypsin-like peptidase domain-containing protein [Permianibacter sp.]|nr:trypsin-like peptidase domain-containing protein [Permianibacter sp.]
MKPVFLVAILVSSVAATAQATSPASTPNWPLLAEKTLPAVVKIETFVEKNSATFSDPLFSRYQPKTRSVSASGSGFILDSDGYVLTAASISHEAEEFTVTLQGGRRHLARLVGRDELLDIALLKIDGVSGLPTLTWQSAAALRMGDPVGTIGYPFDLDAALTIGIVSAVQQHASTQSGLPHVQTSVPIERGHAGSPLLDAQGNVVGMFSAVYSADGQFSGISLAIPAQWILQALPQLKATGAVQRPQIGAAIRDNWMPAEVPRHQQQQVAMVEDVAPESPAEAAGLRPGDIITAFAGSPVNRFADLAVLLNQSKIGTPYALSILRDGKPLSVSVTPRGDITDRKIMRKQDE